ncbi:MAG: Ig-like domain-containing protein, partial [Actinomycetota bacterium]
MASERVRKSTVSVLGVLAVVASLLAALPSPASAATAPVIYLSSTVAGVIGGVTYDDEDILLYSQASDTWSLFFDGSDVLPTSADVDGLHINQNGTIEVSLQAPATVTGLGSVDDSDVLLFTPTSLGSTTAGTWSLVLDGSANGLTVSGEDVLSVTRDGTDRLAVSTLGTYNVPAIGGGTLSGRDEDLLAFDGAAWELWFDGSDVGLSQEELTAMSFDPASGDLFGAARTSFLVPGVAGDEDDIFRFTGTTGASTSGTYTLFFDGDLVGFEQQIDGLYVAFEDNELPVAVDDVLTVGEDDGPTAVAVLDNDSDPDVGDVLTVDSVGVATTGTAALSGGVVTYDPAGQFEALAAGQSATDSFTYTVADGNGGFATATVNVTINGADEVPNQQPVAVDDVLAVGEDDGPTVIAVLDNDSDPDVGDVLAVDSVGAATTGTSGLSGGVVTYDPAGQFEALEAGQSAADSFTYTISDGRGGTATATVNVTIDGADEPVVPDNLIYLSSTISGGVGSIVYADEDIIAWDSVSGLWTMVFDGSDVLPGSADVDGFSIVDDTTIDLSFLAPVTVPGLGSVDDSDIVRFSATSLGDTTSGTFTTVLDGSTVGLATNNEDIDAIGRGLGGETVVSTFGNANVPASSGSLAALDDDAILLNGSAWEFLFDGSDVEFGGVEDLVGLSIDPASGDLFGASLGGFGVIGVTGDSDDVFRFTGTTGAATAGTFTLFFDGDAAGFDQQIDGLDVRLLTPNQEPVAVDDVLTVGEDDGPTAVAVLDNDTDPDAGDVLRVDSVGAAATGTAALSGGVVTYDPAGQFEALAAGQTATESFTYTITDGHGGYATATVNVTINVA